MRTDNNLSNEVRNSGDWRSDSPQDNQLSVSFSGNERNRWFYNQNRNGRRSFADLSTLSGMDSIADGRGFAIWDYNRDGRVDIALSNANAPLLNLYTNQIESDNRMVAIRFVGGATTDEPGKYTSRDGYGAVVTVETSNGLTIKREFRCGEGFAVQNSDTLLVGIGDSGSILKMNIKWPSGITYETKEIEAGTLVTLFENKNDSPTHEIAAYTPGSQFP